MLKSTPILSFCIPTYNRPKELERLLRGVVPQFVPFADSIEFVFKDDSPNNDSEQLARAILDAAGLSYHYYRGEKKGIDPANLFIAEHAIGDFVWWCGDDDEVLPGAVERIMQVIKYTPDLAFIFVNAIAGGQTAPAVAGPDRFFKNGSEFLAYVGAAMTLLSTGVFRREVGLRALPLARKYVGTAFASQPLILEAITSGGKVYQLSGPYLLNHLTELKKGQNLFYDGVKAFGVTYYNLLRDFRHKFDTGAVRAYHKKNFGHIWRGLVIDWIRRDIPAPRNRLWELRMYWTLPEYWLAVVVYICPKPVVKAGLKMYKKIVPRTYGRPS